MFLIQSNEDKHKVAQRVLSLKKENQADCFEHAFKVVKQPGKCFLIKQNKMLYLTLKK